MKKAAVILLIVIYLASSLGLGLREFYCCGKLKSVSVVLDDFEHVKSDKADSKSGCCKTTYHHFKIKDNHVASDQVKAPVNISIDLDVFTAAFANNDIVIPDSRAIYNNHSPPRHRNVPIHIFNCVFRI